MATDEHPPPDAVSILAPGLPNPTRNPRQIFVAYAYKLYPATDYRKVFKEATKAFQVDFVFADEKITNLHILQKISNYIRSSRFAHLRHFRLESERDAGAWASVRAQREGLHRLRSDEDAP